MLKSVAALIALITLSPLALAASTPCPQHFADGEAPLLVKPKLAAQTREICYQGFAVLHSGITRTPLWSAERLTRARVEAARDVRRVNQFHADPHLPPSERAELSDYARSGYDRGHMAPSGDMPDAQSQKESFSLANMIPQNPDNNRHLWEAIESAVRGLAMRDSELYVVTGPIFQGASLQRLHGRVLVPTGIFKAVYDPKRQAAGAYVVPNAPGGAWQDLSMVQLEQMTGIAVFPDLSEPIKAVAMPLTLPESHSRRHRNHAEHRRER